MRVCVRTFDDDETTRIVLMPMKEVVISNVLFIQSVVRKCISINLEYKY